MTAFQTQLAPLETLEQVLPCLLNNLSLSRAQIAIDQIRGAIAANSLDKVVFATASEPNSLDLPAAAVVAIQQTSSNSTDPCDAATIVHASSLDPSSEEKASEIIPALASALDREMIKRGVGFLQWATDQGQPADDTVSQWCEGFGFEQIGTLDYLGGDVPQPDDVRTANESNNLRFVPLDWSQPSEFQRFTNLVEQTYAETLDCPQLADYRTAAETLRGYQTSGAFDANLWFFASERDDIEVHLGSSTKVRPVGCMVLANHQPSPPAENEKVSPVIEIVYMGLVPEARGKGRGMLLVQQAFEAARAVGADRIILAVDQLNTPARAIYSLAGLHQMLSETVWVKSLNSRG